jgi:hypothetical protein
MADRLPLAFDPMRTAAGLYGVAIRRANNPSPRNAAVAAADKLVRPLAG